MKFNENFDCLEFKKPKSLCLVYFLLKGEEVVYVGQTTKGMSRPFQHALDKDFDSVKVIETEKENLDILEGCFIEKYTPKYNSKIVGKDLFKSFKSLKSIIRKNEGFENITIWDIKHAIKKLGIEPVMIDCKLYLKFSDCEKIERHIKEEKQ